MDGNFAMKKVVFIIEQLRAAAGTERIATHVMNELVVAGYDVRVVMYGHDATSFFPLDHRIEKKLIGVPFANRYKLTAAFRLKKIVDVIQPDYVVNVAVPMMQVTFLSKCLGMKGRIITWEHFSYYAGSVFGRFFRLFSAWSSAKMIVLTETDKQNYPSLLLNKVKEIGNFVRDEGRLAALNNKLVVAVGRLVDQKGFDLLLEAWKEVVGVHSDWHLQIIGSGEKKERLQEIISDLGVGGQVSLIPAVKNIGDYYINASIYVMSSRQEPWGLVLAEAKSYGLPVVSFDCPNGPKWIVRDRVDGFLVENGNVGALSDKITELITNPSLRLRMGKAAREDFNKRFSKEIVINKWKEILK